MERDAWTWVSGENRAAVFVHGARCTGARPGWPVYIVQERATTPCLASVTWTAPTPPERPSTIPHRNGKRSTFVTGRPTADWTLVALYGVPRGSVHTSPLRALASKNRGRIDAHSLYGLTQIGSGIFRPHGKVMGSRSIDATRIHSA